MSPTGKPRPQRQRYRATDRRNCRSTYCAGAPRSRGVDFGIRHLRDRRRNNRRCRHHQSVEVGQPLIHGAREPCALALHVDVVGRRETVRRARCVPAHSDRCRRRAARGARRWMVKASAGCDAAVGVDPDHVVEQRQLFVRKPHAGLLQPRRCAVRKSPGHRLVQIFQRQASRNADAQVRRAAPVRAARSRRPP